MKATHKKLTTVLLSLVLFMTSLFALGGIRKAKAAADEIDYNDSIYYFSDSEPVLSKDDITDYVGDYPIYYDYRFLSSANEFKYLLYTGHFWKFANGIDPNYNNVTVVIQILSVTLEESTWDNLLYCLSQQGCKVLLIGNDPYCEKFHQSTDFKLCLFFNYADENESEDGDECYEDSYTAFLKKPFTENADGNLLNEDGLVKDNSAFLLDGRMIGIYDGNDQYSITELWGSAVFRRLSEYMFFGLDEQRIDDFEENFYGILWNFYKDNYLEEIGVASAMVDFSQLSSIEPFIDTWLRYYENYGMTVSMFWEANREEYEQYYDEATAIYLEQYVSCGELLNRNIHFFAHVQGSKYLDLFDWDENGTLQEIYFMDYSELFNLLDSNAVLPSDSDNENNGDNSDNGGNGVGDNDTDNDVHAPITVFAMAKWKMTDAFYDFLYSAQQAIKNKTKDFVWNIDELPVFLWEEDPIQWGSGLSVEYSKVVTLTPEAREKLLGELKELLTV